MKHRKTNFHVELLTENELLSPMYEREVKGIRIQTVTKTKRQEWGNTHTHTHTQTPWNNQTNT